MGIAYRSGMSTKTAYKLVQRVEYAIERRIEWSMWRVHLTTFASTQSQKPASRRVQQLLQVDQLNAPQEKIAEEVLKDK